MKINNLHLTAWLIIGHVIMMLTAGLILIFKFDFPDILRESMEITLDLFYRNRQYTVPAYYIFTLSGISFMTIVMLLFKTPGFENSPSGFLAMVFGVLFGLTSSMGFIRWPFLMQYLGEILQNAPTEQIENIRMMYDSFHIYSGVSVGENFAFWFEFLWTFLFSTSLLSNRYIFPVYLARTGQALGIGMLIYSLEQFGGFFSVLGPLNMIVHTAQLGWLIAISFCLFNINTPLKGKLSAIQIALATGLFLVLVILSFI